MAPCARLTTRACGYDVRSVAGIIAMGRPGAATTAVHESRRDSVHSTPPVKHLRFQVQTQRDDVRSVVH